MLSNPTARRKASAMRPTRPNRTVFIESLETRRLMAATQPSFPNFADTTGLTTNGYGLNPVTTGTDLVLTDGLTNEARSVFFNQTVPIDTFTTTFSYNSDSSPTGADGFTFTIENGATTALGGSGANLGYGGIGNSVAVAFNIFNNGTFGSQFGFASSGTQPTTVTNMTPVDLHSGDTYNGTIHYDGTTLTVTIVDQADSTQTFTTSEQINIAQIIGSVNAIVGFTASTGNDVSNQSLSSWNYTGTNAPTVIGAAEASSTTVTGKAVDLTVLATDSAGQANLTYTWSVPGHPFNAKTPTFSENGNNAAQATTARFYKDGSYRFRVTVTNPVGVSVTRDVSVFVAQTAKTIRLKPHAQHLIRNQQENFLANVLDQFHHSLRIVRTFAYSVQSGGGVIDSATGIYLASGTFKHVVIAATDLLDDLTGTVGATVTGG